MGWTTEPRWVSCFGGVWRVLTLCIGRKFLVATTGIVSGASMVDGLAGVGGAAAGSKEVGI